ncbi:MAG: toprim domain-containing protein, partial [Clostridiales bacterium]|nr:toprim domain-containing protein [Clostridiales bacterium]
MIAIREIIVVEGKYDKMRLARLVDALIFTTDGFRVYRDKEKLALLRRLAMERGVIILTDSDAAGFRIRNYLKQCLGSTYVKHAYIPAVEGREKRKAKPSAEGLLGVEGISDDIILESLRKAGATPSEPFCGMKKSDFYAMGL